MKTVLQDNYHETFYQDYCNLIFNLVEQLKRDNFEIELRIEILQSYFVLSYDEAMEWAR